MVEALTSLHYFFMFTIPAIRRSLFQITLFSIVVLSLATLSFVTFLRYVYAEVALHVTDFPIPTTSSRPEFITVGPDSNLWFTEVQGNKIGKITLDGVITEYQVPTADSNPVGITNGPDGNLWFTEAHGNKIGRITISGVITEYTVPSGAFSYGITTGSDGNVWFTENHSKIGKITPSGVVTEYTVPSGGDPGDITTGSDGNIWFTNDINNSIGRITPTGVITEFAVPSTISYSAIAYITNGPDGNLWFTEINEAAVVKITPSGVVTEYLTPSGNSPYGITTGPDGNIWFMENVNSIGKITPGGVITEYPISSGAFSDSIITGPDGNLWFSDFYGNKIGRIEIATSTPSGKTPVLFIPGLMGTEMKKGSELLWLDVPEMLESIGIFGRGDTFMDPLAFKPDGTATDTAATTTNVVMRKKGLFPFPYDFDYAEGLTKEFLSRNYSTSTSATSSVFALFPYD
jgi:streptogramin lyase